MCALFVGLIIGQNLSRAGVRLKFEAKCLTMRCNRHLSTKRFDAFQRLEFQFLYLSKIPKAFGLKLACIEFHRKHFKATLKTIFK